MNIQNLENQQKTSLSEASQQPASQPIPFPNAFCNISQNVPKSSPEHNQQSSLPQMSQQPASQPIPFPNAFCNISQNVPKSSPGTTYTPSISPHAEMQPNLISKNLPAQFSCLNERNFLHLRDQNMGSFSPHLDDFEDPFPPQQVCLMAKMDLYFHSKNITDASFKESVRELLVGVDNKVLSELQFRIILDKLNGATYEELKSKYGISSESTMAVAISRTSQGRFWDKSILLEFIQIVKKRENDINCLSTYEAKQIAIHLQTQRVLKAQRILLECGCEGLANNVRVQRPDKTWLLKMARKHGLSIVPSSELETMRRIACDKKAIEDFFTKHSGLLQRDPRLIFNMDETMVASNRKFKVVVTKGKTALSEAPQICPHITACVTIGAAGYVMKPLYIIPNKKTIKGLEIFNGMAYFASTKSGWMNKKIFTYWGLLFLTEISKYRLDLPPELRDQRILLLLDGHKSRINFFIAKVFEAFKIDILIFPGHTSHILQAFDVSIASPLKTAYKEFFLLYDLDMDKIIEVLRPKKKLKEIRIMMIKCLNYALSKSANLSNIHSGFKASGIYPLDMNVPLQSRYAMDNSMRERFPDLYEKIKNGNLVNNHHLNGSFENLVYVFRAEFSRMPMENDLKVSFDEIKEEIRKLHMSSVDTGKILTQVPDLIYEEKGVITRINLDK